MKALGGQVLFDCLAFAFGRQQTKAGAASVKGNHWQAVSGQLKAVSRQFLGSGSCGRL